jgi:hypothetical protein
VLRAAAAALFLAIAPAHAAEDSAPAAEPRGCDPATEQDCFAQARGPSVFDDERIRFVAYGEGFANALAGSAKQRSRSRQRNKHDPAQMDEVVTEKLPGIEIAWLHPAKSKERLLYSLTITRRSAPLPFFAIGRTTEQEILQFLGPPASREKNDLRYDVPNQAGTDRLVFRLAKGKLSRVYWEWFLD